MSSSTQKQRVDHEYYLRLSKNSQCPMNLLQRVYEQQVALERIFIRCLTTYGTIRVNNCSFHKRVFVKFTIDQWKTSSVLNTYYSMHYSDNNTDSFQFKLTVPKDKLSISPMNISFAICYCINGQEFWDNNYSRNYNLEVIESTHKQTNSIIDQSSTRESILHDDSSREQIARDYYAIPYAFQQPGNICGLKNLGGICFMNSVLQSLSFTSSLTNYFLLDEYTKKKNVSMSKGIISNEYLNLLYLLCSGKYAVITPAPFKQIIGHVQHVYIENQQQDAHEFLMVLLDYLHRDLNRINSPERSVDQMNNNSIIIDLFYGTYQSTITCLECMYSSRSFDPFVCLTLPIPSINQCTLEDCLTYLNQDEDLTNDSRWFCPKCQHLCNAKRCLDISKFPKILIIQLKRFQLNSEMEWIKNDTLVHYPTDDLNLHSSSYTLYSVINHNGSLNDGHYTTYSRDISANKQQWFECDDEIIKSINSDQVDCNPKAYILFYTIKQTFE